jgi:integrase
MRHGSKGERVKTIGEILDYKSKTTHGYNAVLKRYVLLETKDDPRKNVITGDEWINKMSSKFNFKGSDYEGALKDVPLDKLSRTDIQIWMARLVDKRAAANHALAALSTAIEYDLKRPKDYLLPKGKSNPCVRIAKYRIRKDKKIIDIEIVEKIKNYLINEQWRDAHFNTYMYSLLDSGERQSDWEGTFWKKPNNLVEAKRKGCTGYLYKKYDPEYEENITYLHILDSKNRKPADVELTTEIGQMLDKLRELLGGKESWAYASPFIFPQIEDPSRCINSNSYRVKLKKFNHKFGLGEKITIMGKNKKGKRKIHKYKNNYTLKHLRKSFATYYSIEHGVEATQERMRHSSLKVTQDHYINQEPGKIRTRHMYSMRKSRKQHKIVAITGGKNEQ